jgi:hypothetical protein
VQLAVYRCLLGEVEGRAERLSVGMALVAQSRDGGGFEAGMALSYHPYVS